jgi:ArsR family transcriptional regulator, arsenate/arsenite/antimonite-responsive transcriptional repressor
VVVDSSPTRSQPIDGLGCCVLESPLDDAAATLLAAQLKALADPARVKLISMIATAPAGELCACNLPEALGKSQPTTSHHLHQLLDAGLIEREQRGKWAWFRLRADRLAALRSALGEGAGQHHDVNPWAPALGSGEGQGDESDDRSSR